MLTYEARSDVAPEGVWPLMAEPALWPRWAPQIRGAWGLGMPEVQAGRRGMVRLLGAPVVPALRATYGPLVQLLVRRLDRVAEQQRIFRPPVHSHGRPGRGPSGA